MGAQLPFPTEFSTVTTPPPVIPADYLSCPVCNVTMKSYVTVLAHFFDESGHGEKCTLSHDEVANINHMMYLSQQVSAIKSAGFGDPAIDRWISGILEKGIISNDEKSIQLQLPMSEVTQTKDVTPKCPLCGMEFSDLKTVLAHLFEKDGHGELCRIPGKELSGINVMKKLYQQVVAINAAGFGDASVDQWICELVKSDCIKKDIDAIHLDAPVDSSPNVKCPICAMEFAGPATAVGHLFDENGHGELCKIAQSELVRINGMLTASQQLAAIRQVGFGDASVDQWISDLMERHDFEANLLSFPVKSVPLPGNLAASSNGDEETLEDPLFSAGNEITQPQEEDCVADDAKASAFPPPPTASVARSEEDKFPAQEQRLLSDLVIDISDYRRVKRIARGGFGEVFLYEHNDSLFAVKFIVADEKNQESFEREIEGLVSLSHPFIVGLRGFALPSPKTDDRFVIAMEYVSGGSLQDALTNPPPWFNNTAKTRIICGIALGMAFVHSKGIIHRDLKLANVLLDENHLPHVCDFGSSRLLSGDCTLTTSPNVTPVYEAPEIYDGEYTMKVDVYSFGIMLYEIVTGNLAFRNLNKSQLMKHVCFGNREPIPDTVTPFTRDLIERCWSQDPEVRPSFDEICSLLRERMHHLFDDYELLAQFHAKYLQ